jgi:hypothetical protein
MRKWRVLGAGAVLCCTSVVLAAIMPPVQAARSAAEAAAQNASTSTTLQAAEIQQHTPTFERPAAPVRPMVVSEAEIVPVETIEEQVPLVEPGSIPGKISGPRLPIAVNPAGGAVLEVTGDRVPPVNDDCASATLVPGPYPTTVSGDNGEATIDCPGVLDWPATWWEIDLPYGQNDVSINYCGTAPGVDTGGIVIYNDCSDCNAYIIADLYDFTSCPGETNLTMTWFNVAGPGTILFPAHYVDAAGTGLPYQLNIDVTEYVPAYCAAGGGCDEFIENVSVGAIDNTTGCDGYADFTAQMTDMTVGIGYPITITNGNPYSSDQCGIWVDWNADLDFEDPGEQVTVTGTPGNGPYTATITPPPGSVIGETRMRIRLTYTGDVLPCGTTTYGEVEDYTVNVREAAPFGACCVGFDCTPDLSEADCLAAGGIYQGDGSNCTPNPCVGACCLPDGSCDDTGDAAYCDGIGGIYQGDATDCVPNPCPLPGEDCASAVVIPGVPYTINFDNDENTADGPPASCDPFGTGVLMQNDQWFVWTADQDCVASAVATPTGYNLVMVIWEGPDCNSLTEIACANSGTASGNIEQADFAVVAGNTYWIQIGDTGSIETGGPTILDLACGTGEGACCFPDASCVVLPLGDCDAQGGIFEGANTTCDPNPCTLLAGEDCGESYVIPALPFTGTFDNDLYSADGPVGSCDKFSPTTVMQNDAWFVYTSPIDCALIGTVTPLNTYDPIVTIRDNCTDLTELYCADEGAGGDPEPIAFPLMAGQTVYIQIGDTGAAAGGGETVLDLECLFGTGACCFPDGSCDVLDINDCLSQGGAFEGDGTSCDPNPCPQPVPGDDCGLPLPIALPGDLPFSDPNQTTCGRGDDYDATCLGSYDGGEDILYELTVAEPICVDINITTNISEGWIGLAISDTCPPGDTCLYAFNNGSADFLTAEGLVLLPGTWYLMIDTWPSPDCLQDFNLDITTSTICPKGACCLPGAGTLGCFETFLEDCDIQGGIFLGDGTACIGIDCNNNGTDDSCDIAGGLEEDCNGNGIPDSCDLADGTSVDVDLNGIPDECDPDCNANGIIDVCELPDGCSVGDCGTVFPNECGTALDCQPDGIPDDCQLGNLKAAFVYQLDTGVQSTSIGISAGADLVWLVQHNVQPQAGLITEVQVAWGNVAAGVPITVYVWSDPNQDGSPADALVIGQGAGVTDQPESDVFISYPLDDPVSVGPEGTSFFIGVFMESNQFPAAIDQTVNLAGRNWIAGDINFAIDPNDLDNPAYNNPLNTTEGINFPGAWMVRALGDAAGADCNGNGIPDECDVPPICQGAGCSEDCNFNLIPDECEEDCNGNGRPDDCDIASGTSLDCNENGVPDECDIADGTEADCNNNDVPDSCDLADGTSLDCNGNAVPDECDIADGTSEDCQDDGIPDECQLNDAARDIVLTEGFEGGVVPPAGWSAEVVNAGFTWKLADFNPFEGIYNADVEYDPALVPQDEWLLSPSVQLIGSATVSGQSNGSPFWGGGFPNDNYDVEVWAIVGTGVNDGDDILIGLVDPTWGDDTAPAFQWVPFSFTFTAPAQPFRLGFRYVGIDGAQGSIDAIVLDGSTGAPANDCNQNGIPDECDIDVAFGGFCDTGDCSTDYNSNGIPDECETCGDLDGDGDVDMDDYQEFLDAYGTCDGDPKYLDLADLDADGCITLLDYQAWRFCYLLANGRAFYDAGQNDSVQQTGTLNQATGTLQMQHNSVAPATRR